MTRLPFAYRCAGCGEAVGLADGRIPHACPNRGRDNDVDHVLRREADAARLAWPSDGEPDPFVRYRRLLSSWHVAAACGWSDAEYVALVENLGASIAGVDGRRFAVTPFAAEERLASAIGLGADRLWVKNETGNVSGSHKGRHLAGVMLHLLVSERGAAAAGGEPATGRARPSLAIASCGNAALAAAVVARAARWPLRVFVPQVADRWVMERLHTLGAHVVACERREGEKGDPCYLRFRGANDAGGLPFSCQGPDNGLTIEGGETIAWEIVDALGGEVPDRIFVQVGGGALASSLVQGFADAMALGRIARLPRLHAVQSTGAFPLARAYARVARWIIERVDPENRSSLAPALAEKIARRAPAGMVDEAMVYARTHRSQFMWPWESEPSSVAHGILDDESYDWAVVVEGMLKTGGWPIVVDEEELLRANGLARTTTGIDACHTGTAGLAGLINAIGSRAIGSDERVAVIFSGMRRGREGL